MHTNLQSSGDGREESLRLWFSEQLVDSGSESCAMIVSLMNGFSLYCGMELGSFLAIGVACKECLIFLVCSV